MPTPRTKRTTTGSTFIHETNLASLSIIPHSAVAIVEQQYFMLSLLLSPFLRNLTLTANFYLIKKGNATPFLFDRDSPLSVCGLVIPASLFNLILSVQRFFWQRECNLVFSSLCCVYPIVYRLLLLFSVQMEDMIEWQILAKKSRLTAGECILHTAQLRSLYSFHTAESAVQTTQLTEHGTVCSSHGTFKWRGPGWQRLVGRVKFPRATSFLFSLNTESV